MSGTGVPASVDRQIFSVDVGRKNGHQHLAPVPAWAFEMRVRQAQLWATPGRRAILLSLPFAGLVDL
jgi:hypothetical protein